MITQNTGLDRQPFVQPIEAKGVTHIHDEGSLPHRERRRRRARPFPSTTTTTSVLERGSPLQSASGWPGRDYRTTAARAAAEPVNCPEPEES